MHDIFRKTTILTAIFALLLPSFCLAETGDCSCSQEGMAATSCNCCCMKQASSSTMGCPHCRNHAKRQTDDSGDSVQSENFCHCELTTAPPQHSLFNWDTTATDGMVLLALEADLAPYVPVCSQDRRTFEGRNSLPLPDTRFRQIILCVWLT